jgi:predicted O-methyltransferase YrrM
MRAVDKKGDPIPWYTYPAIDFLLLRNYRDKNILEFGSGQSTLWWGARAKFVLSLEEDPHWFAEISRRVPSNVEICQVPAGIEAIEKLVQSRRMKFDVIIIDGGPRRKLVALSFQFLAPRGVIILDNAEGYGFYEEIKGRECRRIDFFGFAPGVVLRHCTSMAFVDDCFLVSPEIPIPEIS